MDNCQLVISVIAPDEKRAEGERQRGERRLLATNRVACVHRL